MPDGAAPSRRPWAGVRLHGWRHPAILAAAALSVFAGYGQFSVTATLGAVADHFGDVTPTTLGIGLGLIRLASLGSLPLAGLGDRAGRRTVLVWSAGAGLAVTMMAALSPTYWWFVVIVALGRPMLSATNAVAGVIAAEETATSDRAKAIALIAASYSVGAGLPALLRGAAAGTLGFRWVFALMVVPILVLPLILRRLEEPDRFERVRARPAEATRVPRFGRLGPRLRPRMALLGALAFSMAFLTGPVNTNLFVYSENTLGMSPGLLALVVLGAGPAGLAGLLTGRWMADHVGRRWTAGVTQALVAGAGMLTYSGRPSGVVGGYLLGILGGGAYAPAFGALSAELFPTRVRATAAGWLTVSAVLGAVSGLVAFGVLTDVLGSFSAAALVIATPVILATLGFRFVAETKGLELEESAPEDPL